MNITKLSDKAYENSDYIVYEVKDAQTAAELSYGAKWSITSGSKPSFTKHVNKYKMCLIAVSKNGEKKYLICPIADDYPRILDVAGREVDYIPDLDAFTYKDFEYDPPQHFIAKEIIVPDGTIEIADGKYSMYENAKSVYIPNSVKKIGFSTFSNCVSLPEIEIPDSVTLLGTYALKNCFSLIRAKLSKGLTNIPTGTFTDCKSLKSVEIPDGIKSIDQLAFLGCKSLGELYISDSVTDIDDSAFAECDSMTIMCNAGSYAEQYAKENNIKCSISESLTEASADKEAFINKFGQESYDKFLKLKDRLKNKSIPVDIVWHTKNTSVDAMNKILDDASKRVATDSTGQEILNRDKVFENSNYIVWHVKDWQTAMNMGDGTVWCITGRYDTPVVKPSQAKEFYHRYKEDYSAYLIAIPKKGGDKYCLCAKKDSDTFVIFDKRDGVAKKIPGLDTFTFDGHIFSNDDFVVVDHKLVSASVSNPNVKLKDISAIGREVFYNSKIESFEADTALTRVGAQSFAYSDLKTIKLPDSVDKIGYAAFSSCYDLHSLRIPASVTEIPNEMCYNCGNLEDVTFPEGLISIKEYAFSECRKLNEIFLPASIEDIDTNAFSKSVKAIHYAGTVDDWFATGISLGDLDYVVECTDGGLFDSISIDELEIET